MNIWLPFAHAYTDEDYERMLALQGHTKISNIQEILDASVEYTKCMILMENGNLSEDSINDLAQKIAKYRVSAKKKMQEHNNKIDKLKEKLRDELPKTRTVYSVFHTLAELAEHCAKPNAKALLFLDEINRAQNEVMQELMNIILNRTINGYDLPKNCYVVAAANPSSSFSDFRDSEYQVNEFDTAQLS